MTQLLCKTLQIRKYTVLIVKGIDYASCSLFDMISISSFTDSIKGKISSFDNILSFRWR